MNIDEMQMDLNREAMLVVDDNDLDRDVIRQLVESIGFRVESAGGGNEALQLLEKKNFTFMITDMKMPEMDGMELIREARLRYPELGIISITGYAEGYRYIDVINAGATDFIKKPFDVEELEAKARRIIKERTLKQELSRLSITDALTGLYNHRQFYLRLKEELIRAQRQGRNMALVLIDLDDFKAYNDNYGHLAGDDLLRNVGSVLLKCIRIGVDTAYRYGGDEFALILIDADLEVANGIVARIEKEFAEHGAVSASFGVTPLEEGMTELELVGSADRGLYAMKSKRKQSGTEGP